MLKHVHQHVYFVTDSKETYRVTSWLALFYEQNKIIWLSMQIKGQR